MRARASGVVCWRKASSDWHSPRLANRTRQRGASVPQVGDRGLAQSERRGKTNRTGTVRDLSDWHSPRVRPIAPIVAQYGAHPSDWHSPRVHGFHQHLGRAQVLHLGKESSAEPPRRRNNVAQTPPRTGTVRVVEEQGAVGLAQSARSNSKATMGFGLAQSAWSVETSFSVWGPRCS